MYNEMRGNTGGCISCGVGIILGKASKQNMDTKSTTESEVVAVSEYVPYKTHMINIFWDKAILYTIFFVSRQR